MTKDGFISVVMGFTGKQAALAARPTLKHLRDQIWTLRANKKGHYR